MDNVKFYLSKAFDVVFYFYNLLVLAIYKLEDKQRRESNRKKNNFDPDSFYGKMKKLQWKINYYTSPRKFSLREQKDLISTIRGSVRYGNDVKTPFDEMRKRKDLRPFVRMRCDEVFSRVGFVPTYEAMEGKGMLHEEYLALIRVAYRTSDFLDTYDKIVESIEEKIKRRNAMMIIMAQPVITLLVAVLGEVFVSLYLVPELVGDIDDPSTLTGTIASYWRLREILFNEKLKYAIILLSWGLVIYGFFKIRATQFLLQLLYIQIPILNKFIIKWEISKFFSAVNDMIKSGATLQESLTIGINLVGNTAIKSSLIRDIQAHAHRTSDLSVIFADAVYIDERVKNQLKVASNTKTDQKEVLEIIVEEYKEAIKMLMEAPMQLVIPIMLVFGLSYMFLRLVPLFSEVSTLMQNIGT